MATSFNINIHDLEYILRQIRIGESVSRDGLTTTEAIMLEYGVSATDAALLPAGIRTVDGSDNQILPGRERVGAAGELFPRLLDPDYQDPENDEAPFFNVGNTDYEAPGSVVDADPRTISNLIVDQTAANPAAIYAALKVNGVEGVKANEAVAEITDAYQATVGVADPDARAAAQAAFEAVMAKHELELGPEGGIRIENLSPDIGLSPSFNNFMTIFGQFFDHGLDLVAKGSNGTVFVPLAPDDPLIAGADKVFGTADDLNLNLRFMTLTRATPTTVDGQAQHRNGTTSWVDQNQTYTSHASHQAFIREQVRVDHGDGERVYSTGKLLDGTDETGSRDGAIGTWADVKKQALEVLGIRLENSDVLRVPLLATDAYGNLILGPNGYAQMVMAPDATHPTQWLKEGTAAGISTAGSRAAGPAFLEDIAHNAVPGTTFLNDHDGNPATPAIPTVVQADSDDVAGNAIATDARGNKVAYDDELLDKHFITGDGRGNENFGLTAVHAIFHSEHNRTVEANKATILEHGDLAFLNEWLLVDVDAVPTSPADIADLVWDGERMFQAARFSTEMQYQHMVFEEFARRIQPAVDPFVFTNTADIDPSILAEFAHTVYRFGHSMLTDTVDRIDNDLNPINEPGTNEQFSLIGAFLNPQAWNDTADNIDEIQAAIIRGLSMDKGSEIDEFIVPALRSNLLGLPLDLAALNIARGRETGVASLNETRTQLYNDFGIADLKPYEGWSDFAQNLKNPISLINFIAAYGTHPLLLDDASLEEKRAVATALVLGTELVLKRDTDADGVLEDVVVPIDEQDRQDFLNAQGDYVTERGGLDKVDLWIGGLAEKLNEFGGMLGSTFNFIFEYQMEQLQNGDRLYYLSRTQGLNLLNQLEANTFTDIAMRNSDLGDVYAPHMNASLFTTPDMILELDRAIAQADYNGAAAGRDPTWDDPIRQSIDPKVRRIDPGVTDANGHQVGGTLIFRGGEHVVLGGTEGNDTLRGDLGIDALWGDGGNDYLNAGQESDQVFGGDGDDIIEDPFGDNFLRGERGNDVISSARGINLLFGGEGSDAAFLGQDASEVFGDEGNDFILGGSGADLLMGNEGDDWIEGGEGFDTIAGDNSELFFNSTIIGHDVAWGQGNDQDYDLESGDDIALSGIGVQRFEGMWGFDWASAKYDTAGVNFDMRIPIFTSVPAEILRDRFDLIEAFSGWRFADTLRGDDIGSALIEPEVDATPDENALNQAGVDRIDGLGAWLRGTPSTPVTARPVLDVRQTLVDLGVSTNAAEYNSGNILMGGDGNDIFEGRGGFDLIDGDSWLNVRIKIVVGNTTYSAESLNSSRLVAGATAGKVYFLGPDGQPDFTRVAFGGASLQSLLLNRTINPGQMSIVREIRPDTTAGDTDTSIYRGLSSEYNIEGRGLRIDLNGDGDLRDRGEEVIQNAFDVNNDGFIAITDTAGATRGALVDDTDFIRNIEILDFVDEDIDLRGNMGTVLDTELSFEPLAQPGNGLPAIGTALGVLNTDVEGVTISLLTSNTDAFSVGPVGDVANVLSTTRVLTQNTSNVINLLLSAQSGTMIEVVTLRVGSNAADAALDGGETIDILYGLNGNDTLSGFGAADVLYGQGGADTIFGGDGNDYIVGGIGNDLIDGGAGADRMFMTLAEGTDNVNGGLGFDRLVITGTTAANLVTAVLAGSAITSMTGLSAIAGVESLVLDVGDGVDRLTYATLSTSAVVDLETGTATGFASIAGFEQVATGNGADSLRGDANANSLNGGNGNDQLMATVDEAADIMNGGAGVDTASYAAFTRALTIDLAIANTRVTGSAEDAAAFDTLAGIENLIGGTGDDTFFGSTAANSLSGGDGNDTLSGGNGNDILSGDAGSDTLMGGLGSDQLVGGLGDDLFIFSTLAESSTTITDSIVGMEGAGESGGDIIDIGGLSGTVFDFIGTAAFTVGSATQVRYVASGADLLVQIDTDSDIGIEAQIRVLNASTLDRSDFAL
ncbi:peroxidase family protein [Rubellimicrobium aerolatum]|uniref:Peroxidase family protein n=1 Tax=Rubellimicrobium aerolatum TaxID=490979 RepID=A0ABW0SGG1_9RHOB|nr:peroxidase family protein [Rubellimicrobium aerolatum]MBP1807421.1 Ca2+-binding RTX toxin-like protein [Rubellimicrobium aerolatum]